MGNVNSILFAFTKAQKMCFIIKVKKYNGLFLNMIQKVAKSKSGYVLYRF